MNNNIEIFCVTDKHFSFFNDIKYKLAAVGKNNFTIVIVTFKSEKVIETCLNSIDQKYAVIIVENSRDANFKKNIKSKFTNV